MSPFLCENQRKRESMDKGKGIKAEGKTGKVGEMEKKERVFSKKESLKVHLASRLGFFVYSLMLWNNLFAYCEDFSIRLV